MRSMSIGSSIKFLLCIALLALLYLGITNDNVGQGVSNIIVSGFKHFVDWFTALIEPLFQNSLNNMTEQFR